MLHADLQLHFAPGLGPFSSSWDRGEGACRAQMAAKRV